MSNVYYLNTRNERVDFVEDLPLLDFDDFFSSSFSVESTNDIITGFKKSIRNYTLEGDVQVSRIDHISDIFDYDVYQNNQGYFYIGDYYMLCNVIVMNPSDVNIHRKKITVKLTVTTDKPYWLKETKYSFERERRTAEGISYPFSYPFIYGSDGGIRDIVNDYIKPCNFKLTIYGPASNPSIIINGNAYTVYTDISSQEYIEIDSLNRKAVRVNNIGERKSVFGLQDFRYEIYKKIDIGFNQISWSGAFGFDLLLYEERSRPKWISSIQTNS